jgi:hypothetical protein
MWLTPFEQWLFLLEFRGNPEPAESKNQGTNCRASAANHQYTARGQWQEKNLRSRQAVESSSTILQQKHFNKPAGQPAIVLYAIDLPV